MGAPEDTVSDFLLLLPAEFVGRFFGFGFSGKACTRADAETASLDP
jgi:hypothetical protein